MRTLVAVFGFNESVKLARTLSRFPERRPYDVVVVDDGSTDDTAERLKEFPWADVLRHEANRGIGAAIRTAQRHALERGYDVLVHMAGNDKDEPLEIPRLLEPVESGGADFVQGSRYLPGGAFGRMPAYRVAATRWLHPCVFSLVAGRRVTDSTNGFRAYRLSLLKDGRIDLDQPWLRQYELEPYMYLKAIRLGYEVCEVPVTKIYPPKALGYTKIKPVTGWWSILRPLVLVGLGLKQ